MAARGAPHVAIPCHLREDGSCRDRGARRVTADDGPLLEPDVAKPEAVDQADGLFARYALQRRPERLEVRSVEAARVDAAHAAHDDRGLRRGTQNERVELLAAGLGVLLRVVEASERASLGQRQLLEVEENGGRDKRPREGATARFVGTGYETAPKRAVEGEEAAPCARRPLLRGCRCGLAASR
jgi:hypothetical protein